MLFLIWEHLRLVAETPLRYRRQVLTLKQEFANYHSTVLLPLGKAAGFWVELPIAN